MVEGQNDPRMYRGRHGLECAVCGAPFFRNEHAEWCQEIAEFLALPPVLRPRAEHGTVARYFWGCNCLPCHRAWIDHHDPDHEKEAYQA